MKLVPIVLPVFLCINSCTTSNPAPIHTKQQSHDTVKTQVQQTVPLISYIPLQSPIYLKEVDLSKNAKRFQIDDDKISFIQKKVSDYYYSIGGNNAGTDFHAKDTYAETLCLRLSDFSLYLVLVKDFPLQLPGLLVLFYDENIKSFIDETFFINLHTSYEYHSTQLHETELHQTFCGSTPDIFKRDFNQNGITDFTFTRNYHNGTFNMAETIILEVTNSQIDTVLYELVENPFIDPIPTELIHL